ncbi:hypothetical protein AMTR_s00109p00088670 [Amborella trichopoda]|uniref:MULE transposase domain-containing protein n=1 Tax=Amborella trichopoda TaxID=13333 RepID=W1NVC3_AMBTC|nr:hypothetical protein AMTR_s00109p00088670 [Amborella trichopoda]
MKLIKSEDICVWARCIADECSWQVHCWRVNTTKFFKVKNFINVHSCAGGIVRVHQPLARSHWVATWRGKEAAQEINEGSHVKPHEDLAKYLHKIRITNPETVTIIQTDNHDRFETFLKGRYNNILLTVVGVDANEHIFPIVYAVVESENTPSWTWFLELLNAQFRERPDLPILAIVSYCQKGLQVAIEKVFPTSEHDYCMNHLANNFKKSYRNLVLTKLYWKATCALSISDFDEYITKIKSANAEAYD